MKIEDLKEGKYYHFCEVRSDKDITIIIKVKESSPSSTEGRIRFKGLFYKESRYNAHGVYVTHLHKKAVLRDATPSEIEWLDACDSAHKFVPESHSKIKVGDVVIIPSCKYAENNFKKGDFYSGEVIVIADMDMPYKVRISNAYIKGNVSGSDDYDTYWYTKDEIRLPTENEQKLLDAPYTMEDNWLKKGDVVVVTDQNYIKHFTPKTIAFGEVISVDKDSSICYEVTLNSMFTHRDSGANPMRNYNTFWLPKMYAKLPSPDEARAISKIASKVAAAKAETPIPIQECVTDGMIVGKIYKTWTDGEEYISKISDKRGEEIKDSYYILISSGEFQDNTDNNEDYYEIQDYEECTALEILWLNNCISEGKSMPKPTELPVANSAIIDALNEGVVETKYPEKSTEEIANEIFGDDHPLNFSFPEVEEFKEMLVNEKITVKEPGIDGTPIVIVASEDIHPTDEKCVVKSVFPIDELKSRAKELADEELLATARNMYPPGTIYYPAHLGSIRDDVTDEEYLQVVWADQEFRMSGNSMYLYNQDGSNCDNSLNGKSTSWIQCIFSGTSDGKGNWASIKLPFDVPEPEITVTREIDYSATEAIVRKRIEDELAKNVYELPKDMSVLKAYVEARKDQSGIMEMPSQLEKETEYVWEIVGGKRIGSALWKTGNKPGPVKYVAGIDPVNKEKSEEEGTPLNFL